jgi:hypothetical protein
MCNDGSFKYSTLIFSLHTREGNPAEARADFEKRAAECKICAQAIVTALAASKPLPKSEDE